MTPIELSDVQGFIISEYEKMTHTRYLMLHVTDAQKAKQFISQTAATISNAQLSDSGNTCLNIAFTYPGLKALGLKDKNLQTFVREFREGMVTPHRQRLLGDFDTSDPSNWQWGGPNTGEVHVMLLIFGKDKDTAVALYNSIGSKLNSSGLAEVFHIDGQILPGNKEHFGFRDGIAQPFIKGSGLSGKESDNLNAGEFLMGYHSVYDVYPDTPVMADAQGNMAMLPDDAAGSGLKDLGRNGTYLVLRQLQEDVKGYWTFLNDKTKNDDGSINEKASKKLAAKMMGRWPSGAPIVKWPDEDPIEQYPDKDPEQFINDNEFFYNDTDRHGMKCPFGAHARRLNPRDAFEENTHKESIILSNRHRIIRRARPYGEPIIGSPTNFEHEGEVGIMFACFNADISRQFEFLQYTWANYPKFKQLVNDPDPFIGVKENVADGDRQVFTIPDHPTNRYVTGMKRFVHVRGGGYFFFPSLTVIKYLSTI